MKPRSMFTLVTLPVVLVVFATVFLTLLAVGKTDGWVTAYGVAMFTLTVVNLYNERHDR